MVDAESDLSSAMVSGSVFLAQQGKDRPSPRVMRLFYGKLVPREASMLYAISGDPASLKEFAESRDPFYGMCFRKACSALLARVHNKGNAGGLPRQQTIRH